MINLIDNFLNRITMYRLVLYVLVIFLILATFLSSLGQLPYNSFSIIYSAILLVFLCWVFNRIFTKILGAIPNVESVYITALILSLLITPAESLSDTTFIFFALCASFFAMVSKFILAYRKKHIFNPAAIALVLTAIIIGQSASWWIGNWFMMPFVTIGGLLVVRKLRRFDLFVAFLSAVVITTLSTSIKVGSDWLGTFSTLILHSPLLFFSSIMVTEPQTAPPGRQNRLLYGVLTGLLFSLPLQVGGIYATPELALVFGNIFSYFVSPKYRFALRLKRKEKVSQNVYDFIFSAPKAFSFSPGQYLEWTLALPAPDNRGNRRFFTIASSPTENDIRIGVKFYNPPSAFKKRLYEMKDGDYITASQLSGDFVLPKNTREKLVFIAGGIGVTPFRSMIQYLLDRGELRPIVILYSNQSVSDIAYRELFQEAESKIGVRIIYTITGNAPNSGWTGEVGVIDKIMIAKHVSNPLECTYYLSGPRSMVVAHDKVLRNMGVSRYRIKKDYFPGYA